MPSKVARGFVAHSLSQDAQAALTRYNSFEKFTISSKPVIASYIHAGVFVPVFDITPGIEKFTFNPLSNTATKLVYWDQEAYVSELVVSAAEPEKSAGMAENQARSASDKAAAAAEKEGLVKVSKETEAKAKKRKADASAAAKQKKVFTTSVHHRRDTLTLPDRTSPPPILEQPPRRTPWYSSTRTTRRQQL